MHIYMKIGKINGKGKKKRDFLLNGPGGGVFGPAGPPAGDGAGTAPWARAHAPARRGDDRGAEPAGVDRR
jgi:hypothetical protein